MTIGVIIQARSGSSRFPRKIYEDINGRYTLQRVLEGVTAAQMPNKIILIMPEYDKSEFTKRFDKNEFSRCIDSRFFTYFGSPDDLVDRYFNAARNNNISLIVRITSDCPLIQGSLVDKMLAEYLKMGYNGFMGNNETVSVAQYPNGTDIEIFPYWMLAETHRMTQNPSFREHCTPYMYRDGTEYRIHRFENCSTNGIISTKFDNFSFDTEEDLVLIKKICQQYDKHGDLNKAILDTDPV